MIFTHIMYLYSLIQARNFDLHYSLIVKSFQTPQISHNTTPGTCPKYFPKENNIE